MAMNSLKDFSIEWVLFGLLFFSLMTFAVVFMANNNADGLGSAQGQFDFYIQNTSGNLISVEVDSNRLLDISAENNPEVSFQGSKDSVTTSYGIVGNARNFMSSFQLFMGWILVGDSGQLIVSTLVGMFGMMSLYFITKWIRQGA